MLRTKLPKATEALENNLPLEATYERTKRSRFNHSGFLGLKVMNLLNRTWATGAMPIGAPGWPEFAFAVASTYTADVISNWTSRLRSRHYRDVVGKSEGAAG